MLTISPEAATITADDPGVQLLLRRQSAEGTVRDLTGLAAWRVDPPGSAAIEAGGYLRPLAAGKVVVKAAIEGQEVVAQVNVEPRANRSWDFASDVVPVLTRLGCNTGSCHGRADGQNGFHLSLSGYDPDGDYQSLVGSSANGACLMPDYLLDCNHLSASLRRVSPVRERIHQGRRAGHRFISCYPVLCELEVGILLLEQKTEQIIAHVTRVAYQMLAMVPRVCDDRSCAAVGR